MSGPPVTTLIAPFGNPACSTSGITSSIDAEVISEGLMTTVFPAAIAGPTAIRAVNTGEFHGTITATTPSGSRTV